MPDHHVSTYRAVNVWRAGVKRLHNFDRRRARLRIVHARFSLLPRTFAGPVDNRREPN